MPQPMGAEDKQMGPEKLEPIFAEAKKRFVIGAEVHKDKPFFGQFDLWADMREELIDIINYAAMQIIRIDRLADLKLKNPPNE